MVFNSALCRGPQAEPHEGSMHSATGCLSLVCSRGEPREHATTNYARVGNCILAYMMGTITAICITVATVYSAAMREFNILHSR